MNEENPRKGSVIVREAQLRACKIRLVKTPFNAYVLEQSTGIAAMGDL